MADIKGTPGGLPHKVNQQYRDDGDGTHSEVRSSQLWLYDSAGLAWVKGALEYLLASSAETSTIYAGTTAVAPKWAFANVAASGTDTAVVAAVALKHIRVIALAMVTGTAATNVTFNSKPGGAGSAISPLFANAANGGAVLPPNQWGWFQTGTGEGLSVTTGSGSATGVLVQYIEVS